MAYRTADSTAPAFRAADITLHDTNTIECTRAVWVGGAGDLKVDFVGGGTVTITGVPAGTLLPIQIIRAYSTGSTATAVVALF